MNILHIVNSFDPAGDVVRCVKELNLYSQHQHKLYVKDRHPLQDTYQYEEAESLSWTPKQSIQKQEELREWADLVLFQFAGWEAGFNVGKPSAFRNINIYWDKTIDRFWSAPQYNCKSVSSYKLVSSSHVGAKDFLPYRFRWLPDLIPVPEFKVDLVPRKPLISYIKHHKSLNELIPVEVQQNLNCSPHGHILEARRTVARVVIDNVCDGHFGLAGQEAVLMGLPTIVFNHEKTLKAIQPYVSPFVEVGPSVNDAAKMAMHLNSLPENIYQELRLQTYERAVSLLNPKRLVDTYWEPFFQEMADAS